MTGLPSAHEFDNCVSVGVAINDQMTVVSQARPTSAEVGLACETKMTVAVIVLVVLVVSLLCAAGSPPETCYLEVKGPRYDHRSVW